MNIKKFYWFIIAILLVLPSVAAQTFIVTGSTRTIIAIIPFILAAAIFLFVVLIIKRPSEGETHQKLNGD